MSGAREAALAHFGVKGMRWGVRKAEPTSGGSSTPSSSSKRASHPPVKKAATGHKPSPEEALRAAKREHRKKIGKEVTTAVAIAAGTVVIGSLAGPLVAAGAGAVARTLVSQGLVSFPTSSRDLTPPTKFDGHWDYVYKNGQLTSNPR